MNRKYFLRALSLFLLIMMLTVFQTPSASAASPSSTADATATLAYTLRGLPIDRAVQNFYIGETYLYITQRIDNVTYLSRLRIDGDEAFYMDQMVLNNWGHGEALDFYRHNGKEYFMVTTNGSDEYPKYYWSLQIARIEYEAGKNYSSYTGVKRFTNMKRATSDGSSLGGAFRVAACVNGDYTVFRIQVTSTKFVYSIYDTNKLNKLLDSSSPSLPSGNSTDYCLAMEDATSAFKYSVTQEGSNRILPNGNFQGIELSSLDSIYLAGGAEGDTPQIARMTYKGTYAKLVNITNVGTHEIEGLQTDRGRVYFLIVTSTNSVLKKDTQTIYYVNESVFGINHSLQNIPGTKPTCTEEGLSDGATCSKCGQSQDVQETMPVIGHSHSMAEVSPVDSRDLLYFGFANAPEDKERYSQNPVYGGTNYDTANTVRTQNFYKGGGSFDFPVADIQSIDNANGVLKTKVNGPYPTQSSYTGNVSRRFIFGETDDTSASVGSLCFVPTNAEVFQVRFKLENLKLRSDIDTVDPNARARTVALRYYKNNETASVRNSNAYGGSYVNGEYMTVTLPLDEDFTSADVITKILVEFHGFVKSDDSKDAYMTLDYVYIGPKATAPQQENGCLFFDFDDSPNARYRYASDTYGATNFDQIGSWWYNTSGTSGTSITNGTLIFSPADTAAGDYYYVHSGNTNKKPLHYVPGENDYCQVSIKIEDAVSTLENNHGRFSLFFGTNGADIANTDSKAIDFDLTGRVNSHYFTLTFPMDHTNYRSADYINAIRIQFSKMKSEEGKTARFRVEYLYIGPEETLPTPLTCSNVGAQTCSCTTCGQNVVTMETVPTLPHTEVIDEAIAPTCTETGLTEGSHCATCGKVLVAQTTVDAPGHAPVYADNGDKTHTVMCENCDDSEIADCAFENGTCICGATEITEPIYDDAVKFSHSLTLENDISINFIGQGSVLSSFDSFYLECTVPVYEGNEKVGTEIVNIAPSFNGTNYEFTLLGITAKMMNDEIEAVFRLTKDGKEYYSKTDVYSVAEYAYGKLDSTKATDTDELKAICANLLRYGALAQTQFNYRTDAIVDSAMTDAHKAYLTDLNTLEMKDYRKQLNDLDMVIVPWKSTTLELGNKVIMCLIVNLENYTGDPAELTMRLTYVDSNGLTVTEERPLELYNPDAQTYAVSYDGLRATEMRSIVSAAIYNGDTRVSKTVEYSIESYGARSSDAAMRELCLAMLAYGDAANAFFSK